MKAQFISGCRGNLFCLMFPAQGLAKANIAFFPAFGEEVNRSRHVVATQARDFASRGYNCFLIDYLGTGDSEGELLDVSWSVWREDVRLVCLWIERNFGDLETIIWGMRLGCLVAASAVSEFPKISSTLIFWQPVTDGKKYLTQLLRQRIAHLVEKGLPKATTEEMRESLQRGDSLEVGGYVIGGNFAVEIDQQQLYESISLINCRIFWMQQEMVNSTSIPQGTQKLIENLAASDNVVSFIPFNSSPVWQLHERVAVDDLHAKSRALPLEDLWT